MSGDERIRGVDPFAAFRWTGVGASTVLWGSLSVGSSLFDRSGVLQHRCMVEWGRWCVRPGDVAMRVGPPIDAAGLAPADLEPLMERVRAAMLALERDAADLPR